MTAIVREKRAAYQRRFPLGIDSPIVEQKSSKQSNLLKNIKF
ncbi:hypothetical protein VCSRO10_2229 [Vibrio cholerae]|nr:hypothetical protein VCSRO10_2229 [Vibrio cholerae]